MRIGTKRVGLVLGGLLACMITSRMVFGQDSLLVFVKGVDPSELRVVPSFVAYHFDEDAALGQVASQDTAKLRLAGLDWRLVPRRETREPLLWLRCARDLKLAEANLSPQELLTAAGDEAIVTFDPVRAAELSALGYEVETITLSPKPLPSPTPRISGVSVVYDSAVAAIINEVSAASLREAVQRLQDFQTRYTYSDSIVPAGQWIYDQYASLGYTEVKFDTFYLRGQPHRNIIVTKRGVLYPDSVIMLGGHYDSIVLGSGTNPYVWAPGADDNASGTVAALEAARVLANHKFEATIQFAAWDAEEVGLVGSSEYAEKLARAKGPMSLYINFDMVGNRDPRDPERDVTIFADRRSEPFALLISEIARTYTSLVPYYPGNSGGSDHRSFQIRGYPGVYVQEGDFSPNWHRPTDVVDNMDFDYMREVVQTGVATAIHLAGLADNFGDAPYVKYVAHVVDDDDQGESRGNGNGFVDAGETLEILISVRNFGTQRGSGLLARLSTDSPYAQLIRDSADLPDLEPGEETTSALPFVVQIDPSTPNGEKLGFQVRVSDAQGETWKAPFELMVRMPDLVFHQQVVREVQGNGDDRIDPGERWSVRVQVQNVGLRPAGAMEGTLRSLSPDITISDSVAQFRAVPFGGFSENDTDLFVFVVSPEAQYNSVVPIELRLSEVGGYFADVVRFNIAIGQGTVLLVEDNGDDGFWDLYASALNRSGIPFRHWDTSLEGAVPLDTLSLYRRVVWFVGTEYGNSLFTSGTQDLEAYLTNGGRLFLTGPGAIFVLRAKPLFVDYLKMSYVNYNSGLHLVGTRGSNEVLGDLSFWLATEGPAKQGMPTEISVSAPAAPILFYQANPTEGQGDIREQGIAAAAISTDTYRAVYFAFGWEGIEDEAVRREVLFRVLTWLQADVAGVRSWETGLPLEFELSQNFPNPFNPETKISFAIPKPGHVWLAIRDLRGRLVRVLVDERKAAGKYSVTWDGRDSLGRTLPTGVYLYQIETDEYKATRKMILMR